MKKILLTLITICASMLAYSQIMIKTIAGTGVGGYGGDDSLAINAKLNNPEAVSLDSLGNLYIADPLNHRIRKVTLTTGIITTVAGTNSWGYSGDGGMGTDAELFFPEDVCVAKDGNILIADAGNHRIRKLNVLTGTISLVAGNGTSGYSGDGFAATACMFKTPTGVCEDKHGNIYIADNDDFRIRKIDALTGIISTIAGTGASGYSGDNGPATNATFFTPFKVVTDTSDNVIVSDVWNHAIRKISAGTGVIKTIAGNGTPGYNGDGGLAIDAQLNTPAGIFADWQNNIFIAEYQNGVIRKIDGATGNISTVAGNGMQGYAGDGGDPSDAEFRCDGVTADKYGTVYVADYENNRVRKVYNTVGVDHKKIIEIRVFPNPAKNTVTIEQAKGSTVRIFDLCGRQVSQTKMSADKEDLNISELIPGAYLIEITDVQGEKRINKLIISGNSF